MKQLYAVFVLSLFSNLLFAQITLVKTIDLQDYMVMMNGKLLFFGDTSSSGTNHQLWISDGTDAGTKNISDSTTLVLDEYKWQAGSNYYTPIVFNNNLYYLNYDPTHGVEVWKSDGTKGGTSLLKDINPGGSGYLEPYFQWPYFSTVNNELYFAANDGTHGCELWKSDGTSGGTQMVKDISADANYGSLPAHLTAFKGSLYFTAGDDVDGVELFKSDGTASGTNVLKDIVPGRHGAFDDGYGESSDGLFTVSGNYMYFIAMKDSTTNYRYLYRTDGTEAGTILLDTTILNISQLTDVNGTLYFYGDNGSLAGSYLYKSDGTHAGTTLVLANDVVAVSSFYSFNNKLYFLGSNANSSKFGLCVSDGTQGGTSMIYSLPFNYSYPEIQTYTPLNNTFISHALLAVTSAGTDWRVLQSNGTAAGNKIYWGGIVPLSAETAYNGDYYFKGRDSVSNQILRLYKLAPTTLPSGVETINANNPDVFIYPNPFSDNASLQFSEPTINDINYALYDVMGRQVQNAIIPQGSINKPIERKGLPTGIYFYRLTSGYKLVGSGKIVAE